MTCACSQKRWELEQSKVNVNVTFTTLNICYLQYCLSLETWGEVDIEAREDVSLHCTELGNYETLQCDLGLCWCVHPRSVLY